jgi:hypothetical protein
MNFRLDELQSRLKAKFHLRGPPMMMESRYLLTKLDAPQARWIYRLLMKNSTDLARITKSSVAISHRRRQLTRDHLGNAYVL